MKENNPDLAARAMKVEALPPNWREDIAALPRN
jgi:hypothetical protein